MLPACLTCGMALSPGGSASGLCPACLLTMAMSEDEAEQDATLATGTLVGPFRIVRLLGRGGMAAVYQAEDPTLERAVALKVLPASLIHDRGFARRFEQEARVVARLEHPHVVPIYTTGIDAGVPFMSMRLLVGGNLGERIADRRPSTGQAVQLLRDSAAALDYAHSRGVIHRDVKPTNLLLDSEGRVSVADFGLARLLDDRPALTRTGQFAGTPEYMAPEQALGAPLDHRCDIYSLGIVAYELFAGRAPFVAASPMAVLLKQVNDEIPEPAPGSVPDGVMLAIRKAAAKQPDQRWTSATAFVEALGVAMHGSLPIAIASAHVARPARWRASTGIGAAVICALLFLLVAARWSSRPDPPAAPTADVTPPRETAAPAVTDGGQRPFAQRAESAASGLPTQPAPPAPNDPPRPLIAGRQLSSSTPFAAPPASGPPGSLAPAESAEELNRATAADAKQVEPPAAGPVTTAPDAVVAPVRLRAVAPEYPSAARAAQIEGDVVLEVTVGVDGRTSGVLVVKSVHPLLDAAATKAVLQYRYSPALRNGDPEASTLRIAVSFRLR